MRQLAAEVRKGREVSSTTLVGETMILDKVTRDTTVSRFLTDSFGEDDARRIIALSHYQVLPGNMSDKVILDQVLSTMKKMEVPGFTLVGDRSFYSEHNLALLSREGYKFTIPVLSSDVWQKKQG